MTERFPHLKKLRPIQQRPPCTQSCNATKITHPSVFKNRSFNSAGNYGCQEHSFRPSASHSIPGRVPGTQIQTHRTRADSDADHCSTAIPNPKQGEDVEVSLELEIDESLKNLIGQGSLDRVNHSNRSVDVTFIQEDPKDTESRIPSMQATVSLGVDEITQLIDMVHSKNPQVVSREKDPKAFDFDYYTDWSNTQVDLGGKGIVPERTQEIYTSPQQTYNQIRKKLPCLVNCEQHGYEHSENGKLGSPCLCQHCGMVGVLIESQKRPAIPHTPNPKFSGLNKSTLPATGPHKSVKKIIDLRTKSKSETNLILLKELTIKIAMLEDRLNEHEEKTVKKDYFKFVIHKLLTQYSTKINELKNAGFANKQNVNIATQYSKKSPADQKYNFRFRDKSREKNRSDRSDNKSDRPERDYSKYYPVKVSRLPNASLGEEEDHSVRWGMHRRGCNKSKSPKKVSDEFSKRTPKVYNMQSMASEQSPNVSIDDGHLSDLSAHAIKNLCSVVYQKFHNSRESKKGNYAKTSKETDDSSEYKSKILPDKLLRAGPSNNAGARNRCYSQSQTPPSTNVAYVSPAVKTWHVESEQEFVLAQNSHEHEPNKCPKQQETRDEREKEGVNGRERVQCDAVKNKVKPSHSVEEKIKYLRFLAKRKNVNEFELWSNILNQAKKHIRSNEDTVSIQLPNLPRGPEMSELELSLSRLKEIARRTHINSQTCHQNGGKQSGEQDSPYILERTSSERLNPFNSS